MTNNSNRRSFSFFTNNLVPIIVAIIVTLGAKFYDSWTNIRTDTVISKEEIYKIIGSRTKILEQLVIAQGDLINSYHKQTLDLIEDLDAKISNNLKLTPDIEKIKLSKKKLNENIMSMKTEIKENRNEK